MLEKPRIESLAEKSERCYRMKHTDCRARTFACGEHGCYQIAKRSQNVDLLAGRTT